ncbi:hypothetical protein GCM10011349_25990 [Novosphingobium indicum]|uniref:Uncharacterized protein n=1 Tax=Novosphingobium indicum TaxID=462949 RepID=A0ABQ2JSW9_9SPHN|nr:hypothetical protein [Novosphingobium indicum]GGN52444.1 hypothetical protein GCM10011349_25990 [Novosphingobium indicum]|tara:strand:- start:431 stop:667 length:237 start_codon:yes stop_codon:yes gene_type:complete
MELTSAQCRAQEAIQSERAKSEPLENVRVVALRAAIAWGHEASFRENREASKQRARTVAEIMQLQRQRTADDDVIKSP